MKSERQVVVSGIGAVSCLGHDAETLWAGLTAGRCGIRPLERLSTEGHRITHGGEVPPLPDGAGGEGDLAVRYSVIAGEEALRRAGLEESARAGIELVTATNFGAMASTEAFMATPDDAPEEAVFLDAVCNLVAGQLKLNGGCTALSLSCASGNAAIGCAADRIRAGRAEAVLAIGYDAISPVVWAGLAALRAMTSNALRPFDARRDGTIFAEGAGALLLESAERAASRGMAPLVRFRGWGASSNAFHMTHPDPDGGGMVRAMRAALADAGLSPDEIDHVNAHATATKPNDTLETAAIKAVFGEHAPKLAINGIKSMIGHGMGAASAIEAIACVQALREGIVPPTIGLEEPDPECDLDYTPLTARRLDLRAALNNAAGFGGCNASVIFSREATP